MFEKEKDALGELVKKWNERPTIDNSGFKLRPVNRDDIRFHCQACGSYKGEVAGNAVLIGDKEFESFTCLKCNTVGLVPSNKKPMSDIYGWLAALKKKIEAFHLS